MLHASEISYIAGIIDGEGCIGIYEKSRASERCQTPAFIITVVVSMTEPKAVNFIGSIFKGRVRRYSRTQDGRCKRDYYRFDASCKVEVKELLTTIHPYIRVKQPQVSLGIDFCNLPSFNGGRGHEVPADEVERRRFYVAEMHRLNSREV